MTVEMQEKEEELKQNMEQIKANQEEAAHKIYKFVFCRLIIHFFLFSLQNISF